MLHVLLSMGQATVIEPAIRAVEIATRAGSTRQGSFHSQEHVRSIPPTLWLIYRRINRLGVRSMSASARSGGERAIRMLREASVAAVLGDKRWILGATLDELGWDRQAAQELVDVGVLIVDRAGSTERYRLHPSMLTWRGEPD